MTIYLLNASVLTAFGDYIFSEISLEDARNILNDGYVSAIGHQATAKILSSLLNIPVEVNRINVRQEVGDKAVVFWLLQRQAEGVVLETVEEIERIGYKFGLIERVNFQRRKDSG